MLLFEEIREVEIEPGGTVTSRVNAFWHPATAILVMFVSRGNGVQHGGCWISADLSGDDERKEFRTADTKIVALRQALDLADEWFEHVATNVKRKVA